MCFRQHIINTADFLNRPDVVIPTHTPRCLENGTAGSEWSPYYLGIRRRKGIAHMSNSLVSRYQAKPTQPKSAPTKINGFKRSYTVNLPGL